MTFVLPNTSISAQHPHTPTYYTHPLRAWAAPVSTPLRPVDLATEQKFYSVGKFTAATAAATSAAAANMSESEGDKKRNKLGYQRISVACAHCRRRKIRCVMAEADPHNRCQNCIRLNKECIFHPVEQQQGTSESGSVAGQQSNTISHSPRDVTAGQSFDTRPNNSYTRLAPLLSSNAPQLFTGLPYDPHSAQSTPHSAVIDYRSQQFGDTRWPVTDSVGAPITANAPPPMGEPVEGSHDLYWNSTSDEYGNLGGANRALSPDARSYSFPSGISAEQQWQMLQQPARAMSYGAFEGQPQYAPHQGMTGVAGIQQSVPHPPRFPIDTQSASGMRGVPGPHSAPISGASAPGFQQTSQHYGFQNPQFHGQQDMSGSWLSGHEQQGFGDYGSSNIDDSDPTDSNRRRQQ